MRTNMIHSIALALMKIKVSYRSIIVLAAFKVQEPRIRVGKIVWSMKK